MVCCNGFLCHQNQTSLFSTELRLPHSGDIGPIVLFIYAYTNQTRKENRPVSETNAPNEPDGKKAQNSISNFKVWNDQWFCPLEIDWIFIITMWVTCYWREDVDVLPSCRWTHHERFWLKTDLFHIYRVMKFHYNKNNCCVLICPNSKIQKSTTAFLGQKRKMSNLLSLPHPLYWKHWCSSVNEFYVCQCKETQSIWLKIYIKVKKNKLF